MIIENFPSFSEFWKTRLKAWRRQWQPTPVLLPGKSHGWRSLVGCSPWGREESDTTEWLHFHFSLSCIGEGNGNRLQCSCLENARDGGAWWAAISGVAQSRTWLKRLSSSSSRLKADGWIPYRFLTSCSFLVARAKKSVKTTFCRVKAEGHTLCMQVLKEICGVLQQHDSTLWDSSGKQENPCTYDKPGMKACSWE